MSDVAAALLASFDRSFFMNLEEACQRFCAREHSTFTRDAETGIGHTAVHHTDRLACATALVDASQTFGTICRAFS